MFRPPSYHPQGGPPRHNAPYPGHSVGVTVGAPYVPPTFPMHGRGGFHPPFNRGPYHSFPPSGPPSLQRPPPPPGSPPSEAPPPPPPSEGNLRPTRRPAPPPPPRMPKDPEMLKNIEVLSSFVVKNGPQFENMARAKQAGDPKFSFLFGGDWGTEAALGFDFYNWKKEHLLWMEERSRAPPADAPRLSEPNPQGQYGGSGEGRNSQEPPASPTGSDMDMEDDFALPVTAGDIRPELEKNPAVSSPGAERKSGLSPNERISGLSSSPGERVPEFSSPMVEIKAAISNSTTERKPLLPSHGSVEFKLGNKSNLPGDQESCQLGASGRALPIKAQVVELSGPEANAKGDKKQWLADVSRLEREITPSNLPKRRDARRRTGFDRPCMEDVNLQASPVRGEQLETHPAHRREAPPVLQSDQKSSSANGHEEAPVKPSRWGPPEPFHEHLASGESLRDVGQETRNSLGKGTKKLDSFPQDRGNSSNQLAELDVKHLRGLDDRAKDVEKLNPKSGLDQPVVDEFGRLLRQGGSDTDEDDNQYSWRKKRRRTSSRSRSASRSPGGIHYKHWSPGRSPHQRGRRSRSWSRSPRRNRSRSPPREGRWGGDQRGDRGRRGSRVAGGPPPTCFDFVKGKCFRGSSCRFSHEDSKAATGDQVGRWTGGRGQSSSGKESGQDGERNWGDRNGDPKLQRSWESSDHIMENDSMETKLIEPLRKQRMDYSSDDPGKQDHGNLEKPLVKSAEEPGQTSESQPTRSSSEILVKPFGPFASVPCTSQSGTCVPIRSASQVAQQLCGFANPVSTQSQPDLSLSSTSTALKLGSLVSTSVSQQSSFMVSPTPHSQQFPFSAAVPQSQQPALTLSSQHVAYQSNLPTLGQTNGFASCTVQPQPAFTAPPNVFSGSPPLPTLQPSFAPFTMGRSQPSCNAMPQANFANLPHNGGSGGIHFRPPVSGAQPQMLQNPMVQNLQPRSGLPWVPGGVGPTVSYPLGSQLPPLQAPPPPSSTAPNVVYSYSVPVSHAPQSYSLPPKTLPSQPPGNSDQYDPLADSLEPEPPGSGEKVSNNQNLSQGNLLGSSAAQPRIHLQGGMSASVTRNPGTVVLENVSPGLPGYGDNVRVESGVTGNMSPVSHSQVVMENVSPSSDAKALLNLGSSQQMMLMENVSPPDENPTEAEEVPRESKTKEQKKKDKEGRVLNLIRKAVAEQVKDLLKPTWKEGQMSKEAFKTIAKKAVDKVMGALEAKGQIPKSQEKLDLFMTVSKPKIAKLVQGYVDKYVKS